MKLTLVLLLGGLLAAAASAQTTPPAVKTPVPGMLPAGHPDIAAPTTQPAAHGTLVIRARQGTKDGPALKGDPVIVELYHQDKIIRKIETVLDDKGMAVLTGLSLLLDFQPLVKVKHAGVDCQVVGRPMSKQQPNQQIEVPVYEVTEQDPGWQVHMRHVMLESTPQGLNVMEMLAIENPSDRTWLGTKAADGTRRTIVVPLSADIIEVRVNGDRYEGCIREKDGSIVDTQPLPPGVVQVQLNYSVPAKDGQVSLSAVAPALIKNMIVFAPEDGSIKKVEGLEATGTQDMPKGKMQMYRGMNLPAGHKTTVAAVLPMAPVASGGGSVPKIIAAVGAGLILVVGIIIIMLKKPTKT
jgi:hypothetical protein